MAKLQYSVWKQPNNVHPLNAIEQYTLHYLCVL